MIPNIFVSSTIDDLPLGSCPVAIQKNYSKTPQRDAQSGFRILATPGYPTIAFVDQEVLTFKKVFDSQPAAIFC